MSDDEEFQRMLTEKLEHLKSDFDYDALEHLNADTGTKLSRLPDFPELSRLRGKHPDIMYLNAVRLRADRNEVEEKILVPLRRMLAAWFQYQSLVGEGKSLVEDDDRPVGEMMNEAGSDMFAQIFVLAKNLLSYDLDPVSATGLESMF